MQRSGFQYEKAAAQAAIYNAFFSLIRLKYGTLMHWMRSPGGVVVRAYVCQMSHSSLIHSECARPVTRFSRFALHSFISLTSEPCIRVRVRAAMPAWQIANQPAKRNDRCSSYFMLKTGLPLSFGEIGVRIIKKVDKISDKKTSSHF